MDLPTAAVWIAVVVTVTSCTAGYQDACAGDYRIGSMHKSDHWDKKGDYNENHSGVFAEFRVSSDAFFGMMEYENSFDKYSQAFYYSRDLPINKHVSWGYQLGMVSGYDYIDPAPWMGILLTFHAFDRKVNQRTIIIPAVVNAYQVYGEF